MYNMLKSMQSMAKNAEDMKNHIFETTEKMREGNKPQNETETDKNICEENVEMISIKRLEVSDKCSACGICFLQSNAFAEDESGKAIVVHDFLQSENLDEVTNIASMCPEGAISIKEVQVKKLDREQFKEMCRQERENAVQQLKDKYETFAFDAYKYEIKCADFNLHSDFRGVSRSWERTEEEGFRYFKNNVFPLAKQIIQNMLIEYKKKSLSAFFEFEKNPKLFEEMNKFMSSKLRYLGAYYNANFSKNINLDKFSVMNVTAEKGISGVRDLYTYRLEHLEEIFITETVMSNLDPYDYDCYVDSETSSNDSDMYYWSISRLVGKFYGDIKKELNKYMNGPDSPMGEIVGDITKPFYKKLSKAWNTQVYALLNNEEEFVK